MTYELQAPNKYGTWAIVDRPYHMKPIRNKRVYKVKHNDDGTIAI